MTGQLGTVGEARTGWPGVPGRSWVPGAREGVGGKAVSAGGPGLVEGGLERLAPGMWLLSAAGVCGVAGRPHLPLEPLSAGVGRVRPGSARS